MILRDNNKGNIEKGFFFSFCLDLQNKANNRENAENKSINTLIVLKKKNMWMLLLLYTKVIRYQEFMEFVQSFYSYAVFAEGTFHIQWEQNLITSEVSFSLFVKVLSDWLTLANG